MDKCFYVDKTIAFQKLEKSGRKLKLWRPRRCGKSLLRDQLKLYCDKMNADSTVRFYDFISLQLACKNPTNCLLVKFHLMEITPLISTNILSRLNLVSINNHHRSFIIL